MSRNPSVVTNATGSPARWSSALVATVDPCTSRAPSRGFARVTASMTARWNAGGVEGTLTTRRAPDSNATRSVNVPPTSTPTIVAAVLVCSLLRAGIESRPMQEIPGRRARHFRSLLVLSLGLAVTACNSRSAERAPRVAAPTTAPSAQESVGYLASDALEGRGVGTKGIDAAADYIANRFKQAGLRPAPGLGGYFQVFPIMTGAEVR